MYKSNIKSDLVDLQLYHAAAGRRAQQPATRALSPVHQTPTRMGWFSAASDPAAAAQPAALTAALAPNAARRQQAAQEKAAANNSAHWEKVAKQWHGRAQECERRARNDNESLRWELRSARQHKSEMWETQELAAAAAAGKLLLRRPQPVLQEACTPDAHSPVLVRWFPGPPQRLRWLLRSLALVPS